MQHASRELISKILGALDSVGTVWKKWLEFCWSISININVNFFAKKN